ANDFKAAVNPAGMPAGLKQEMPAIKEFARIMTMSSHLFEAGERKFEEKRVFYVDSTFLDLFSFPLLKGTRTTVLHRIDGVLITESIAKKYFGKEEALGKTLRKDNGNYVTVTGVLADIPSNSHLQFD